jgi:hypothetical protein
MEINLSELTLTSFNSVKLNLTEFTSVRNLVVMVTMEHNPNPQFRKAHLINLNLNNFETIEVTGLKVLHRGPLEWHYLRTKFHEYFQKVQMLLVGNTQTDW